MHHSLGVGENSSSSFVAIFHDQLEPRIILSILFFYARQINMLLINLFSLIINLDTRIFILDLFCHDGIYEASTKKESMHISKNFIFPPRQRLLKITRSRFLLTSINSCSIKSSQNGSITFCFWMSKVSSKMWVMGSSRMYMTLFLSSSIFSPWLKSSG